ncbi:exodeoxyribonuclease I [Candidatus Gillettellia adelgis]
MSYKAKSTFYIYDYETFGISPSIDRPAQFAGVRTDTEFNIIDDPLVIYCTPSNDYLPEPESVLIHGITPQEARYKGINEVEFARQIHQAFSRPGTCILGYNNIYFDDEFSRNIFYRNFYDSFSYSWQNGNSRWDLLNVMRTCYALRPEGIIWPKNKIGFPSFRLEDLTYANNLAHSNAHDAMSDVYATIAIAKQVKLAQPKLFDFLHQHRNKNQLNTLIDCANMTPLVHVSNLYGRARGNTSLVAPVAWHPGNKNAVIMCDLTGDMTPLLTLSVEQLYKQFYRTPCNTTISPYHLPMPIKLVRLNTCPVLAPANTLLMENAERLGINCQTCLKNLQFLRKCPEIREKIVALFSLTGPYKSHDDVDSQLYNGFFTDTDKIAMKIIHQTKPQNLREIDLIVNDKRMKELLFRFRARNYPNTLNDAEKQYWIKYCQITLSAERIKKYYLKLQELCKLHKNNKEKLTLLNALFNYGRELTSTVLIHMI